MLPSTLFIPLQHNGSTWGDNELRIALRSWEKYTGIQTVVVIGHKPGWFTGEWVACQGKTIPTKTHDIWLKTQLMASMSKEFVFGNDDHFLLQPLINLPYYYQCRLDKFKGGSDTFMRYVSNTTRLYPDGKYFDVHTPMIIDSSHFNTLTYTTDTILKSVYCNSLNIEGEPYKDCKINQHMRREEIEAYLHNKPMFSVGDAGLSNDMRKYLFELFPQKSKWEK